MGIRTIILVLCLLLSANAKASEFSGENGFGNYSCNITNSNLYCLASKEPESLGDVYDLYVAEKLNITIGRAYTITMIAALTSLKLLETNREVDVITIDFEDGWAYQVPFNRVLACVLTFEDVESQVICVLPELKGGLRV